MGSSGRSWDLRFLGKMFYELPQTKKEQTQIEFCSFNSEIHAKNFNFVKTFLKHIIYFSQASFLCLETSIAFLDSCSAFSFGTIMFRIKAEKVDSATPPSNNNETFFGRPCKTAGT